MICELEINVESHALFGDVFKCMISNKGGIVEVYKTPSVCKVIDRYDIL